MKIKCILFLLGMIFISNDVVAKSLMSQVREDHVKVVIDYSALINLQLDESLCEQDYRPTKINGSGIPVKMLGAASVYMGVGPGNSKFGHLGERFVYCIGKKLFDTYYDGIKLTNDAISLFEEDYPDAGLDYLSSKKIKNALYYRKIQNPTQQAVYGLDTIQINRNIYEQWLDISEGEMLDLLMKNIKRRDDQNQAIANEEKLKSFSGILNNCTYQITEDLQMISKLDGINQSIQPKHIYKFLTEKKITKLLVIYPSQEKIRELLFKNSNFGVEDNIKLLEIPLIELNPKYSENWNDKEMEDLKGEFKDYKSPLGHYFQNEIGRIEK